MDMRLPQVVPLDLAAWQLVAVDVGDPLEGVLVEAAARAVILQRVPGIGPLRRLPAAPDDRGRLAEILPAPGDRAVVGIEVAARALREAPLRAGAQQGHGGGDAHPAPGEQLGQAVAPER